MAQKPRPARPIPRRHLAFAWSASALGLLAVALVWGGAAVVKPVDQGALAGHLHVSQETVTAVTEGDFTGPGQITTTSGTTTPYTCLSPSPRPGQQVDVTRLDAVTSPGRFTLVYGEVVFIGDCAPADLVAKSGGLLIKHYQPQVWSWARGVSAGLLLTGLAAVTHLQNRRQKAAANQNLTEPMGLRR